MMTRRTPASYTDQQALLRATPISFDSLRARPLEGEAIVGLFELSKVRRTHPHHVIIEWPDGVLVCVVSNAPIKFVHLSPAEVVGAYRHGLSGNLVFPAHRQPETPSEPCGLGWSLPLFKEPLTTAEVRTPSKARDVADLQQVLRQFGRELTPKMLCECEIACRRANGRTPYFVELAVWNDGEWSCLHFERVWRWPVPPGQYEKAYHSARSGQPFYHLDSNTTPDLILHLT